MECAQCGALVPAGRRTCPACGTPVASASTSDGVEALLAEANLYRSRSQFDEAISACMRVLQRDAANAAAHSLIADIYRDQGNYREALNWFKLAVELNPDNEADRKKLDDMIDRVFQGVLVGEVRSGIRAAAQPPASGPAATAPDRRKPGLMTVLARIQPVYVAVVVAFLITGILVIISFRWMAPRPPVANISRPKMDAKTTPTQENALDDGRVNANSTAVNISITPPPPDAVESGADQPRPIPGLPGIAIKPGTGNLTPPTTPKPATNDTPPVNPTPAPTPPQVPPLSPLTAGNATHADEVELRVMLLKMTLEHMLETSKLPSKLDSVAIDPRTNALTVKYTIPHMNSVAEAKQGLLYTGFHLIWTTMETAAEQNKAFTGFTLIGNAYSDAQQTPSLSLVADVLPQQAEAARSVTDYKTVQQYLTKPWWRDDLARVAL